MKKTLQSKSTRRVRKNLQRIMILSIILFTPFILEAQGNSINIPDDFAKIQDAINNASEGDTIIVAPGTYYENVNFRGKNILLTSHYFYDEDVSFINTTIIDGSKPLSPDTASVVLFLSGEDNTAVLQGFTITGGKGTKIYDTEGNYTSRIAGGVLVYHSSPTIRHNIIAFNESINPEGVRFRGAGGLSVQISSAIISNNIIYKNNATDGGGALLGPNPGSIFRNNIIAYNRTVPTGMGGGGLFIRGSQGKFINNTIAFNQSGKNGGISFHNSPSIHIENCIIYYNKTGSANTQIGGAANINITNTNIEGGRAGDGNIDEIPLFADFTPLMLQAGSPCVDKGDTNTINNDWEDTDHPGFPMPPALGSLRNDMGAYGGNQYKSMPYMHMLEPTKIIVANTQNENNFVPGVDTVVISSKIVSPENQSSDVIAVFKSSDGSLVDTIIMVDDGTQKDSLAGDGWYTAAWAAPDSEGLYTVDISVYLKDYNEVVFLENASNFATVAPITGIEDEYETIQNKFELHQNYPNPFNLSTTIGYSVSQPGLTSLKVYNITGKEVKTLVNEQQAIGSYKIEFDASSLPGGMYFYKIEAGEFSEIKKLLLVR